MTCIIVDDEPLAREGMKMLVDACPQLTVAGSFNSADSARKYLAGNTVDLIFLDIQMPGTNGIDFARSVGQAALVIFTTAYAEFALDSYEVDAVDYLVKPIRHQRFTQAVDKALAYFAMLQKPAAVTQVEQVADEYFFVKADRKIFKISFKDILIIEGLKDYVVLYTMGQKIITAMNIKTIHDQLPRSVFVRVSKSYIINVQHIVSFDNNTVFVQQHEVPIGSAYRSYFFDEFVNKKLLSR